MLGFNRLALVRLNATSFHGRFPSRLGFNFISVIVRPVVRFRRHARKREIRVIRVDLVKGRVTVGPVDSLVAGLKVSDVVAERVPPRSVRALSSLEIRFRASSDCSSTSLSATSPEVLDFDVLRSAGSKPNTTAMTTSAGI